MRLSNHANESTYTRSHTKNYSSPNLIKITPYGYEALTNAHDWLAKSEHSKLYSNSAFPQKIRLIVPSNAVDDRRPQESIANKQKGKEYINRKAARAFQKWTKNQEEINKNVTKQLAKRQNQKSKMFQWSQISCQFKGSISGILNKWQNSVNDEKERAKQRLSQIHTRKNEEWIENKKVGQENREKKKKEHKENRHVSANCSFL